MKLFITILFLLLLTSLGFMFSRKSNPTIKLPSKVSLSVDPFSVRLMALVNDWRVSQNLQPYTESKPLCSIASERLPEIQKNFSHDGFYPIRAKYLPNTQMSENIVSGFDTEQETLTAWLNSPEHRKNLDADYRYSCIKCQNTYCVQEFANF